MESANVAGWKPARPVHAPEAILEEQEVSRRQGAAPDSSGITGG